MNEIEIAWAAGLMDGEGTFQIASDARSGKYYARMRLGMCHHGAVKRFGDIMGVGNVCSEKTPARQANYWQYRWSTSGQNAINCAKLLLPYLVVKRHEAEILIRWEPTIANGRNVFNTPESLAVRKQLYDEMKAARSTYLTPVTR
jgi:hypothetical protein